MHTKEDIEKAKQYLDNEGYGTGSNFTLNAVANLMAEYAAKNCVIPAVMPSLPIEKFDAEDWLGENKDIWNHPRITDRNDKESYEVADLMAEFANVFFRQ